MPSQRRGGDDRAAPALAKRREGGVRAEGDPVEVDAHRPAVELELEVVVETAAARDARVQKGEVEPAAALAGEGHRRAVVVELGHVAADGVAADAPGDLLGATRVDVDHYDLGTRLGERERGRRPDAACASGDERDAVAQRSEVDGGCGRSGQGGLRRLAASAGRPTEKITFARSASPPRSEVWRIARSRGTPPRHGRACRPRSSVPSGPSTRRRV
jgi:hypothetical protein